MSADLLPGTRLPMMPFSNSAEGYGWMANWCDRCIHDKPARQERHEDACTILTTAMCNQGTPIEWLDGPSDEQGRYSTADQYHCIQFRDEDEEPPPRTEPLPTPPGQGELIPMEPFVGVRMFADVVREATPDPPVYNHQLWTEPATAARPHAPLRCSTST